MITKIDKVMDEIEEMEVNLDGTESNSHYYTVEYKDGKIIISVVEEYYYYDECDEYTSDSIKEEFAKVDASFKVAMNTFFDILTGASLYYRTKKTDYRLFTIISVKRF